MNKPSPIIKNWLELPWPYLIPAPVPVTRPYPQLPFPLEQPQQRKEIPLWQKRRNA